MQVRSLRLNSEFIKGDSFKVLPTLPSESFDLIHADPPYGRPNKGYGKTKDVGQVVARERRSIANDQNLWWLPETASQLYRILKPDKFCVVWGSWENFDDVRLLMLASGFDIVTQGIWDKGIQGLGGDFCNTYEIWGVFEKGNARAQSKMIQNVIRFQRLNGVRPDHPHLKPKEVIKKLISYTSAKNDIVLDPFAGSGSTAISCLELNRQYFCIEIDEDDNGKSLGYVDKAMTKIKAYHDSLMFEFPS